ncbi:MAG TPA: RluA family pseudouridine synthase [Candidatus Methylacidiphilales bacterium]|jgi:23S rRNA pseudouridine1911/1915/1917 synthase|nr:RluA family pseudouridine synthase [Candidatus Methylacidiphilales bacterium]
MTPARTVSKPSELLAYLFEAWPETKRKQVRAWLKFGSVAVNGKVVTQFDHGLKPGDTVTIRPKGMAAPETKLAGGIRVRHEDADIIVIEKPAGLLSIASASEEEKTAYAFLTDHVRLGNPRGRERVWVVHRLDRETSGLMIFAKNEEAKVALQNGWDAVEKKYLAVVEGAPAGDAGKFDSHLDESNPLKVYPAKSEGAETRRAVTRYRVMKKGGEATLVELTLETGRRHQIRVQLAEAGCPIVGDKKYGAETNPIKRIALHATSLRFIHPVTRKEMRFDSALPGDLGRLV